MSNANKKRQLQKRKVKKGESKKETISAKALWFS